MLARRPGREESIRDYSVPHMGRGQMRVRCGQVCSAILSGDGVSADDMIREKRVVRTV